jgi:putative FmdB family regulatory protein
MPIFEYLCEDCGKRFEVLMRGSEKPQCPKCKGTHLEQQFSAFAMAAASSHSDSSDFPSDAAPGCGQCGMDGGGCGMGMDDD